MASHLSHLDENGNARMVDVSEKPVSRRAAVAEGFVTLQSETVRAISENNVPKGDVLAVARVAGIMAAKRCGDLIPLCHPLPIEALQIQFELPEIAGHICDAFVKLRIQASARIVAKTGVEMEALTAVSIAALTIYDMCKAIDKKMTIDGIHLIEKSKETVDPAASEK